MQPSKSADPFCMTYMWIDESRARFWKEFMSKVSLCTHLRIFWGQDRIAMW